MTNLHGNDDSELGGDADEVIFTTGATEANSLALRGIALAHRPKPLGSLVDPVVLVTKL